MCGTSYIEGGPPVVDPMKPNQSTFKMYTYSGGPNIDFFENNGICVKFLEWTFM